MALNLAIEICLGSWGGTSPGQPGLPAHGGVTAMIRQPAFWNARRDRTVRKGRARTLTEPCGTPLEPGLQTIGGRNGPAICCSDVNGAVGGRTTSCPRGKNLGNAANQASEVAP